MARIRVLNENGEYEELPLMRGPQGEKGEKGDGISPEQLEQIEAKINKKTKVIFYKVEE